MLMLSGYKVWSKLYSQSGISRSNYLASTPLLIPQITMALEGTSLQQPTHEGRRELKCFSRQHSIEGLWCSKLVEMWLELMIDLQLKQRVRMRRNIGAVASLSIPSHQNCPSWNLRSDFTHCLVEGQMLITILFQFIAKSTRKCWQMSIGGRVPSKSSTSNCESGRRAFLSGVRINHQHVSRYPRTLHTKLFSLLPILLCLLLSLLIFCGPFVACDRVISSLSLSRTLLQH